MCINWSYVTLYRAPYLAGCCLHLHLGRHQQPEADGHPNSLDCSHPRPRQTAGCLIDDSVDVQRHLWRPLTFSPLLLLSFSCRNFRYLSFLPRRNPLNSNRNSIFSRPKKEESSRTIKLAESRHSWFQRAWLDCFICLFHQYLTFFFS